MAKAGKFQEAIDIMTDYGEIKHKNYFIILGNAYVKTNNFSGAYEAFSKYLELDPDNEKIQKLIGVIKQRI